jgi:succinyl-CoA synthetase alpha subunit
MVGEIGGADEELASDFIQSNVSKPVVAHIAGKAVPKGRRMGHAGAIISGNSGKAQDKINSLKKAGVFIAESPSDMGLTVRKAMGKE